MTDQTEDHGGEALTSKSVDDSLPADPAIKPEQDAKSPSRAKRQLAVVAGTDIEKAGKPDRSGKKQRSAPDPITGLTEKQELFCQHVIGNIKDEDGNVMSLSDAYRASYVTKDMTDKSVNELACRLFADVKITSRLKVLAQEKEDNRRMMAAKDAEIALQVFREMAADKDQPSARVRAAELLGKTAGLFTDKVEFEDKTDRSTADIERAIKDRLARLGLTG